MNLVKQLFNFLQRVCRQMPSWVNYAAPEILAITAGLRNMMERSLNILESDSVELLLAVIPGTWDDELKEKMTVILERSIPVVVKLESCKGDIGCMIRCFLDVLSRETSKGAKAKLIALASTMLADYNGRKYRERDYDFFIQTIYSKIKNG